MNPIKYKITLTPSEVDYTMKRLQRHADIINHVIECEYDRYTDKEISRMIDELHKIYPILSEFANAERID